MPIVSTSINEKTQKMLPVSTNENRNQRENALVSTNENAISQKTFFVSTRLDKYKRSEQNIANHMNEIPPIIGIKIRQPYEIYGVFS